MEPNNDTELQMIHRALISEIFIPENCILVIDENLIHSGTETMTCGYSPVHSPRYFTYVHHKDSPAQRDVNFNKFFTCGKDCKFCTDSRVMEIAKDLKVQFDIFESEGLSLAAKDQATDWIAGDMKSVGWVVARNGVAIDDKMEKLLGHEFKPLYLQVKW